MMLSLIMIPDAARACPRGRHPQAQACRGRRLSPALWQLQVLAVTQCRTPMQSLGLRLLILARYRLLYKGLIVQLDQGGPSLCPPLLLTRRVLVGEPASELLLSCHSSEVRKYLCLCLSESRCQWSSIATLFIDTSAFSFYLKN
jgi:hypothetical protein